LKRISAAEHAAAAALSADGAWLAAAEGSQRQSLRVLDVATEQTAFTLNDLPPVLALQFDSSRHQLAIYGADGSLQVVDARSGRESFSVQTPPQNAACLGFTPDGRRLALGLGRDGDSRGGIRLWETRRGRELLTVPTDSPVDVVTFSPSGLQLAALCHDGSVFLLGDGSRSTAD
jgi:WD40 repeat protein